MALLSEGACASATGTSVRAFYTSLAEFNAVACGHPRSFLSQSVSKRSPQSAFPRPWVCVGGQARGLAVPRNPGIHRSPVPQVRVCAGRERICEVRVPSHAWRFGAVSCRVGGLEVKVLPIERAASVHGHVSVALSSFFRCKTWPLPCLCVLSTCLCSVCPCFCTQTESSPSSLGTIGLLAHTPTLHSVHPHTRRSIRCMWSDVTSACINACSAAWALREDWVRLCGRTAVTLWTPCWCFSLSRFPSRF